ncbi:MAG: YggT family protein [Pseudomonadota bacterium]|nr:YggT family protein [Pseudomonadota bacterium]
MQYGNPFLDLILVVLKLYSWALIISVILSWLVAFNVVNTHSPLVSAIGRFLYRLTEPLLKPIRQFLPDFGGIDISPVVLLLLIWFVENLLITYWPF